jgi:type I restriction enzyme, S subunit
MDLITNSLDVWTSAQIKKNTVGRGSNGKQSAYGIKKLRELILELAVRGKLVPQDLNGEPVSVLLEKIAEEKARLIKEGKLKKQSPLPEINDGEKPFKLPEGWEWTRFGEVTNYGIADKVEPSDADEKTWVLELEDVEKETSKILQKIRYAERQFRSSKNRFSKNDVIYGKLRPYLDKAIVADEEGVCTTEMIPVRGYDKITPHFLRLVMKSPYFIKYADESTHGMNLPRLGTEKARLALFPMVPENEQHRIVVKVDELMALCDQLEQQQTDSNAAHQTLVETLLGTLTNPVRAELVEAPHPTSSGRTDFEVAWKRIAEHFDTLFTTEHSIDQLKQTVLQLAVMGKLVPQDPNDEPASVLLEKIAKQKARLIKEGKIKNEKLLAEDGQAEMPFELAECWEWVKLDNIVDITSGITKGRKLTGRKVLSIPYLRVANVQRGFLALEEIKHIDIPEEELEKFRIIERDLLITEGGDWDKVGRTAIWRGELPLVAHQNHVFKARLLLAEQNEIWLEMYLNSIIARDYFAGSSKQTTNLASINKTQLRGCLVAIPPIEEQHRIVAKVEELMALCDALKARINEAQTTQIHLADAIVEQAVA